MSGAEVALVLGAFAVSGLLKGISGIGFSTICLGLLAGLVDIKLVLPLVILPSVASNLAVMRSAGGFGAALRRFRYLYLAMLPGLAAGLAALSVADSAQARRVLGTAMLAYGLYELLPVTRTLRLPGGALVQGATGALTGLVNGLTGCQVMPVVPWLLSRRLPPDVLVQAANIGFTLSSAVMLAGLGGIGLVNAPGLALGAAGIVPVMLAVTLGARLRQRLGPRGFRRGVVIMLCLLGLNLVR